MNKRSLLPVLSTALLAPAFLAGQVYAEEATTPAESSAVVATPATSATPAPVESPVVPETSATSATSEAVAPAETPSAPAESTKSEEKDTVILHTNDVHGRIVEEKGVIGDAKLATVIEQERAKSNQNTLVVDAGDAFQGLPISNSTKGEARAEILNQMQYD
ncbi:bifunctional metallophosphatase/5'-nucleotidase, partial [Streptococcus oralis]|nr:bifunctional metallophosphatase/5'-nucleotidase [Streptococcus oralis]